VWSRRPYPKEKNMEFLTTTYGLVAHTVIVFVAGTLIGKPLWEWLRGYLPWNK